jgi:hypothetical protein
MTGNDLALVADGLVALLLAVVIGYAVVLNRRLRDWRAQSTEMERQMATLNATLVRAEVAVNTLKGVCKDDGAALDAAQRKAQSLRDDLAFLVERGGSLADRLEQAVRAGRAARGPRQRRDIRARVRPRDVERRARAAEGAGRHAVT